VAEVDGLNAGYARTLLDEYLENPEGVPSEWRALFESGDSELLTQHPGVARLLELMRADGDGQAAAVAEAPPEAPSAPEVAPAPVADETLLGGVAAAMALVKAYRTHGHLAARLDPLGSEPVGDPALEPERLVPPLTPELQAQIPARLLRVYFEGETLADVLPKLQETYAGTSAYEVEHISDHQERVWLRQAIETGTYRTPLPTDEKRRLLARLTEVEGFERYLRRAFLGQKQFSIEGLDALVPMLDTAIDLAATSSTTSALRDAGIRRRATSPSRSPPTRATSRLSTRSSRAWHAASRRIVRHATAHTTRASRSPC
jgi:2-oxoglutarate dehydrogenase complex dehydrogenase (E1) component-like enzyme